MRKTTAKITKTNKTLHILILSFLLFGLIVIANSTVVYSNNLYGSPYKFTLLQLGWILIGLCGFYLFYKIDYKRLEKFSEILFYFTLMILGLLALFSFFPCDSGIAFAPCINGANRWVFLNPFPLPKIPFIGVLGFQPGELAKMSLILFLSFKLTRIIDNKEPVFKKWHWSKDAFLFYCVITGLVSSLILLQPNMSTASMIFLLGTLIYFVSGASLKNFTVLVPTLSGLSVIFMLSSAYRRARLFTLLKGDDSINNALAYHIKQILIALGSGGIFGVGFGASKQKYQYLPEIASDSIFAVIGEEFGFIGTFLLLAAFLYLIYKGFMIAKKAPDLLGVLLSVGITSWMGLQVFVNVAAMTRIIPLTGVPLPLISYGGSSMVFSLMGLGILANINEHAKEK